MVDLQQGFVLTRHWRDTPAGTQVEFWLATDQGPRHLRLPYQSSVAFVPAEQRERAQALLHGEPGVEWRPLALRDFHRVAVVFGKMRNQSFQPFSTKIVPPWMS